MSIKKDQKYVINWDKVKTVEDVIRIMRMMGMTITPETDEDVFIWGALEDLMEKIED